MFERMLMTNTGGGKAPEVIKEPIYSSPILASDGGVDWLGEVSASNFITGNSLSTLVGMSSTGTSQYSTAGWLHVGLDGTELLIAKRPFRRLLGRGVLDSRNLVFGNRIVSVNGQDYKIRLMKGANSDPTVDVVGWDVAISHGSEWNRIFYRLTENVYLESRNSKASEEPFVHLANYSEADLALDNRVSTGSACYCQERFEGFSIYRGYWGVSRYYRFSNGSNTENYGWRPVLEKV